jgi:thiol:disulfide interchange protein
LLAFVMLAVCVVVWLRPAPVVIRLFGTLALVGAIFVGLITWGLLRSLRLDAREVQVDAAVMDALAAGAPIDCGHEHDPTEMHVTDAEPACSAGPACDHTCAECVLARSPNRES